MSFARHLLATTKALAKGASMFSPGVRLSKAIVRDQGRTTDMFNETAQEKRTPFEETLCAMAGRVLVREYPGFHWAVRVNEETGMFYILNQDLSGEWGYRGKVQGVFSATDFEKEVLMAAGGILEFFGIARAPANQDALVILPTDFSGRTLPAGYKPVRGKRFDPRKFTFNGKAA